MQQNNGTAQSPGLHWKAPRQFNKAVVIEFEERPFLFTLKYYSKKLTSLDNNRDLFHFLPLIESVEHPLMKENATPGMGLFQVNNVTFNTADDCLEENVKRVLNTATLPCSFHFTGETTNGRRRKDPASDDEKVKSVGSYSHFQTLNNNNKSDQDNSESYDDIYNGDDNNNTGGGRQTVTKGDTNNVKKKLLLQ
eukprot:UN29528